MTLIGKEPISDTAYLIAATPRARVHTRTGGSAAGLRRAGGPLGRCGESLEVSGEVTDPRARRGVRYSAHAILAAVAAGARSLTTIGHWVGEAPAAVLWEYEFGASAPMESTIRRLL